MQDYPEKLCPATNEAILHADKRAVQELVLWAENTREVQDALAPITKNLARHFLRGEYDPALAVKSCYPVADIAAISYERVFGINKNATKVSDVTWCTPRDRRAAAYDILGGTQDAIREAVDALSQAEAMESQTKSSQKFEYQLLSRLQQDNEYYLGYGGRSEKHLWAGNVDSQIAKMRELYDGLEEKPEWLTPADIDSYEQRMCVPGASSADYADQVRKSRENVKTLEGWEKSSSRSLYDYLQIGDQVDAGMVEYFRNVVSPTTNDDGLVQAGEAYSRQAHPLTGEIQDTYLTFTALAAEESASWVYCGDCFRGDIIPHVEAVAAVHPENKALSIHAADYKDRLALSNGERITNEPSQPSPVKDARLSRASASTRKAEKARRHAPAKTQR